MDTPPQNQLGFFFDVLPSHTRKALDFLAQQTWLVDSPWYLAGGTALALQVGHRKSVDLDFFTQQGTFSTTELLTHFMNIPEWKTDINSENTVYGELCGAKVSFIAYPFFVPKEKYISYGFVRMLVPADIAVMKIIAVSQRGRKRDFIDLYWLITHGESLEDILRRLQIQYPSVAHDYHHILKSLVYFDDAETDPMSDVNFKVSWAEVKIFFVDQVPLVTKRLIDLS
jgi:Nucleotidyl transferase AbiEii toxin, Type IV TA system